MRRSRLHPAVLLALSLPVAAADAPPAPAPALSAVECAVWDREMGFARSVADHDAAAFADHVGEQAAFGTSGPKPIHGRAEIVRQWRGIIEGKRVRLEWYPARTTANGAGDLAWSTGPALTEVLDPAAKQRFHLGHFRSVWRKDADGAWRVVFDDGDDPRPATAEEAAAFRAARPTACPRG